jgi:hypothetical protein
VSVFAGAASNGNGRPQLRTNSPAGRAHVLAQTAPQSAIVIDHDDRRPAAPAGEADQEQPSRRRWPIVTSLLAVLVLLILGGGYAGWRYTQDQYYVGADRGHVTIFRGVNGSVAGIGLSHVFRPTGIPLAELPMTDQQSIRATISASTFADAQRTVTHIRSDYLACHDAYTARRAYFSKKAVYQLKLNAYNARSKNYKKTHKPPTAPTGGPVPIPPDCPAPPPSGTAGGSGNGSGSGAGGGS